MKECSVKMETTVSEIQVENKDEKRSAEVSPQDKKQEDKTSRLCFKRRKKAAKTSKPKAGTKAADVARKHTPEAGASDQPQRPGGTWASIKLLVTRRKKSDSSKQQKSLEAEVQPEIKAEDADHSKKKAKSRLKIPCIKFSRGAQKSNRSKIIEDSDCSIKVQGEAEGLDIQTQTQLNDQTTKAKSTQDLREGAVQKDGDEVCESNVSDSRTAGENVISVELELDNGHSAIQTGTLILEKEIEMTEEKQSVQPQQVSPLASEPASSETDSQRSVASGVPPVASGVVPVASGVLPVASGVSPVASGVSPVASDVPPVASDVSPVASGILPVTSDIPPVASGIPLVASDVPPVASDVPPVASGPPPVTFDIPPVASDVPPVVSDVPPVASDIPPVTFDVPPVASGIPPVVSDVPPVVSDVPPVSSDVPAVASDVPPVASGIPPVASDVPPVASDVPPVASDVPPVASGISPVASDVPPVASGIPPVLSDVPAVASDVPPVASGVSPVASDIPPVASDVPPVASGLPPVTFDVPPVASDVPPVASGIPTVASGVLPVAFDVPPVASDVPPVASDVPPVASDVPLSPATPDQQIAEESSNNILESRPNGKDYESREIVAEKNKSKDTELSQEADLKENEINAEKPKLEEIKRMEPIAIIITDTEISEFDVKKSKNVPKQFLISIENEQVGVFANDSGFEGRTSEQYETLLIETASSLVKNAIQLSVEQLVNEMASDDNKINTPLQ